MLVLLTDVQFASMMGLVGVVVTAVPAGLAAYWSRGAKKESAEAKQESAEAKLDSADAKESAAAVAYEVMPNGGMTSPVPNLNDHVQYQTQMLEKLMPLIDRVDGLDSALGDHIRQSDVMNHALAELYLERRGELPRGLGDNPK